MVLEKIKQENDIKKLSKAELPVLADEIRDFLIQKISVSGGHLASIFTVFCSQAAAKSSFGVISNKTARS